MRYWKTLWICVMLFVFTAPVFANCYNDEVEMYHEIKKDGFISDRTNHYRFIQVTITEADQYGNCYGQATKLLGGGTCKVFWYQGDWGNTLLGVNC